MNRHLDTAYLRAALTERGWQQAELAQAVGVSDAAVSQWLGGEHLPRPGMLLKIAMAIGAPVDRLLISDPVASDQPLVAYRRKGQQQTTAFQEDEALDQGFALE
ncbi:MAG: XRE family transcriptional regulator, partial [Verrucomicrobiaceae bacterium]